jgi:hypothetical protein
MLTLVVIGALNWGLVGFFQYDLIAGLFGGVGAIISRILYAIVGLAGLYCVSLYTRLDRERIGHHHAREATVR